MKSTKGFVSFIIIILIIVLGIVAVCGAYQLSSIYGQDVNMEALKYYEENGFKGVRVEVHGEPDNDTWYQSVIKSFFESMKKIGENEKKGYYPAGTYDPGSPYQPGIPTIYVYPSELEGSQTRLLLHEYGHHVYYHVITDAQKERYKQIYATAEKFVNDACIAHGVKQDFAISYAEFKLSGDVPEDRHDFFSEDLNLEPR